MYTNRYKLLALYCFSQTDNPSIRICLTFGRGFDGDVDLSLSCFRVHIPPDKS